MRVTVLVFLLSPVVFAQNAGQQTQQVVQQAQQAQQIAIQQTQQAQALQDATRAAQQQDDAARRANQQAMDAAAALAKTNPRSVPSPRVARTPRFSPKPGTFTGIPPQVRITTSTNGAVIYYTTDGSTPTSTSQRYRGPIRLSTTTTLKAMAVAPASSQSPTAQGKYIVK